MPEVRVERLVCAASDGSEQKGPGIRKGADMNRFVFIAACLSAAVVLRAAGAGPKPAADATAAGARELSWRITDNSAALLNGGKMVWEHVHDPNAGKPYMRLALLDGTELTRPWPFPKDYKPNDHLWHKALWWSWKSIDGVNVWEQNAKGTFATKARVERRDDGSAVIAMDVVHGPDAGPPLVNEKRTVSIGAPDASGAYLVQWQGVFTPAGAKDVVFGKNWYGGFAMRCAGEMRGKDWQFFDPEGRKDDRINRQTARWVAMTGKAAGDRVACVAVFDHPSNPRHPSPWCVIKYMPYFNPAFTGAEDYALKAGSNLTLRYGVLVAPAQLAAADVERHWKAFSEKEAERSKPE
jgi:hypothetical protein